MEQNKDRTDTYQFSGSLGSPRSKIQREVTPAGSSSLKNASDQKMRLSGLAKLAQQKAWAQLYWDSEACIQAGLITDYETKLYWVLAQLHFGHAPRPLLAGTLESLARDLTNLPFDSHSSDPAVTVLAIKVLEEFFAQFPEASVEGNHQELEQLLLQLRALQPPPAAPTGAAVQPVTLSTALLNSDQKQKPNPSSEELPGKKYTFSNTLFPSSEEKLFSLSPAQKQRRNGFLAVGAVSLAMGAFVLLVGGEGVFTSSQPERTLPYSNSPYTSPQASAPSEGKESPPLTTTKGELSGEFDPFITERDTLTAQPDLATWFESSTLSEARWSQVPRTSMPDSGEFDPTFTTTLPREFSIVERSAAVVNKVDPTTLPPPASTEKRRPEPSAFSQVERDASRRRILPDPFFSEPSIYSHSTNSPRRDSPGKKLDSEDSLAEEINLFAHATYYRATVQSRVVGRPSFDANPIATVEQGERILIDGRVGEWYRMRDVDGQVAFVFAQDFKVLLSLQR